MNRGDQEFEYVVLDRAAGRIDGLLPAPGNAYDVKTMQAALENEQNLLRALIDGLPDHIYVKDMLHRFVVANAALWRFMGASAEADIIGRTDWDFFPADTAAYFMEEERQILRTGQPLVNREANVSERAGHEHWVLTSKLPLRDGTNCIVGIIGFNRDITEHKRDQEQIRQRERDLVAMVADLQQSQERMKALQLLLMEAERFKSTGSLAAGVAHEVKNPLAIIGRGIEYLARYRASISTEDMDALLKSMSDAVQRANTVAHGLLDFSASRAPNATVQDMNRLIENSLVLVKHEMGHAGVVCRRDLAPNLPAVCVDAGKIEQVFVNLFTNAIHAMRGGGELTVRTQACPAPESARDSGTQGVNDPFRSHWIVRADVQDTGAGIPEDMLARVFDPFFSTKPTGQGTGLGLTVSRAIVEMHGGTIEVRNRLEGGVVASLTLKAKGVNEP